MIPSCLHGKCLLTLLQHLIRLCILAISIESKSSPIATQSLDQKQRSTDVLIPYDPWWSVVALITATTVLFDHHHSKSQTRSFDCQFNLHCDQYQTLDIYIEPFLRARHTFHLWRCTKKKRKIGKFVAFSHYRKLCTWLETLLTLESCQLTSQIYMHKKLDTYVRVHRHMAALIIAASPASEVVSFW